MSDEEREAFERKLVQEKEAAAAMVAAKETELRAAQEAADARQAEADAKLNELEDAVGSNGGEFTWIGLDRLQGCGGQALRQVAWQG